MDLALAVLLVAGIGVLVGAAVQGAVGMGLGLIGAPVLALLDPPLVPGTILLVTSVLPMLTSVREMEDVDWRGLSWALLGRLPGLLIGAWVVVTQPARVTAVVVAVVVLGAVALSVTSWHARPTPRALLVAGVVSGVSGTATSTGGPPVAMLYQHASGATLRSTMGPSSSAMFCPAAPSRWPVRSAAGRCCARWRCCRSCSSASCSPAPCAAAWTAARCASPSSF